jgi:hypothetical protein
MAKVYTILVKWHGCQNMHITQNEFWASNILMAAIGYISNTQDIVKVSQSLCPHVGGAVLKLLETKHFQLALHAKDMPAG